MRPNELFDTYFEYVLPNTESSSLYHRWCLVSIISATLGKRVHLNMGHFKLYGNMYIQLIGPPGVKKSSAISNAVGVLRAAGFKKFAPSQVTQGAFLEALSNASTMFDSDSLDAIITPDFLDNLTNPEYKPKPAPTKNAPLHASTDIFIPADEWVTFIRAANGTADFLAQLGTFWDCPDRYTSPTKTAGNSDINHPYVCILSGNTPAGFARSFRDYSMEEGILTRMILVSSSQDRQRLPFPEELPKDKRKVLIKLLKRTMTMKGVIVLSPEAKQMLSDLYTGWEVESAAAMQPYYSRRYTHLLKLCLILASVDEKLLVDTDTVVMANTMLAVTEKLMANCVTSLYADNEVGAVKSAIIEVLIANRNLPEGEQKDIMKEADIFRATKSDVMKLKEALTSLVKDNRISLDPSTRGYMLKVHKLPKKLQRFVNFELLQPDELQAFKEIG